MTPSETITKAANVPIIVAINKCDLPEKNISKIKNEMEKTAAKPGFNETPEAVATDAAQPTDGAEVAPAPAPVEEAPAEYHLPRRWSKRRKPQIYKRLNKSRLHIFSRIKALEEEV